MLVLRMLVLLLLMLMLMPVRFRFLHLVLSSPRPCFNPLGRARRTRPTQTAALGAVW